MLPARITDGNKAKYLSSVNHTTEIIHHHHHHHHHHHQTITILTWTPLKYASKALTGILTYTAMM